MVSYATAVLEVSGSIPGSEQMLYDLQIFLPEFGCFLCMYKKKEYMYSYQFSP